MKKLGAISALILFSMVATGCVALTPEKTAKSGTAVSTSTTVSCVASSGHACGS